jgi:hypothetical protein
MLVKLSVTFHENPFRSSRLLHADRRGDREADIVKLIGVFFATAAKTYTNRVQMWAEVLPKCYVSLRCVGGGLNVELVK